uniref:TYR_PHOSPHATASE_2 domain-containing protein n=1 Tax=Heterorhabditis bacteriophora TaxID=37862 RepID=A0A1I7XF10_HETBA
MNNERRYNHHRRRGGGESGRKIPDRWLNYDPVGRDLEGTRFVPFKTPLDKAFFNNKPELTEHDYFDVHTIVQYVSYQVFYTIQYVRYNINVMLLDDFLIGVHCTHGLNRTGYLICRYMIDRMGWTAAKAISHFEHFRGHPIERNQYKTSLYEAEKRLTQNEKARSTQKNGYADTGDVSGK